MSVVLLLLLLFFVVAVISCCLCCFFIVAIGLVEFVVVVVVFAVFLFLCLPFHSRARLEQSVCATRDAEALTTGGGVQSALVIGIILPSEWQLKCCPQQQQ